MMSDLNLRPVKPVRLFEQVAEQIQSLIVAGQLQPGDRLPSEAELGAAHGVSRSVVREALRALESKGLIEVRSGAGASVALRPFSFSAPSEAIEWLLNRRDSLMQLLQVRESVEGLTASLAAISLSDDLLEELRQVVQQQEEMSGSVSNLDRLVELDVRFHTLIADASGNDIAEEIVSRIVPAFCDSNRVVLYLKANMEQTLEEHHHIIDALASGEPGKAEAAMRAHIARVRSEIQNLILEGEAPGAVKLG